jgi:hypothetical protein
MTEQPKTWFHLHHNGMRASVIETPLDHDRFGAHAALDGQAKSAANIRGLGRAKAYADANAKCPQPCTCPPWSE